MAATASVASLLRITKAMPISMTRTMSGIITAMSRIDACMKASFMNAMPEARMSRSGCLARIASTAFRAASADSVTSRGSLPGRRSVTFTAAVRPSRARRLPASSGSEAADARMCSSAAASSARASPGTSSATVISSPSLASGCWKLVSESTRVAYGKVQPTLVSSWMAASGST